MKNFYILADALEYIESHLCEPFTQDDVAAACYCSRSSLQKLFRFSFHFSVKEYISKRRISRAAADLLHGGQTVTEIAMRYQYNSPEVFTRAFVRVWHVTPSEFNKKWNFAGLCPKIYFHYEGGNRMNTTKQFDITELYDYLSANRNAYVICFDIEHMLPVNRDYGREAGDAIILAALKRIDAVKTDAMLLFRIGGDEFVLVTGTQEEEEARELMEQVLCQNGNTVQWQEQQIPLSLHGGMTRIGPKTVRYEELFHNLQQTIDTCK